MEIYVVSTLRKTFNCARVNAQTCNYATVRRHAQAYAHVSHVHGCMRAVQ